MYHTSHSCVPIEKKEKCKHRIDDFIFHQSFIPMYNHFHFFNNEDIEK